MDRRVEAVQRWLREERYRDYPRVEPRTPPPYGNRAIAFVAEASAAGVREPLKVARALLNAIDPVTGMTLSWLPSHPPVPPQRVLAQVEALPLGLDRERAATFAQRLVDAMGLTPRQTDRESEEAMTALLAALTRATREPPRRAAAAPSTRVASEPRDEEPAASPVEAPVEAPARPVATTVEGRAILGVVRVADDMTFARDGVLQRGTRVPLLAWRSDHEAAERRSGGVEPKPLVVIGWLGRARFVPAESIERD